VQKKGKKLWKERKKDLTPPALLEMDGFRVYQSWRVRAYTQSASGHLIWVQF